MMPRHRSGRRVMGVRSRISSMGSFCAGHVTDRTCEWRSGEHDHDNERDEASAHPLPTITGFNRAQPEHFLNDWSGPGISPGESELLDLGRARPIYASAVGHPDV